MKDKIIEICCGSCNDAISAYQAGASRIELNSALYLGGLTPSSGMLRLVKQKTELKVICMVRPRAAGFCYDEIEFETMIVETEDLLKSGADGIAFGCLNNDKTINLAQTKKIIEIIKSYNKEAVFHRAFDCVNDPFESIELLIDLKVDRVLTSGLSDKAIDGVKLIKALQAKYGEKIEILVGSGINTSNAKKIIELTKVNQVHSSCKGWRNDETTTGNNVSYSYLNDPHASQFDIVDKSIVRELINSI